MWLPGWVMAAIINTSLVPQWRKCLLQRTKCPQRSVPLSRIYSAALISNILQPRAPSKQGLCPHMGFCLLLFVVVVFYQLPCFYLFSYCSHIWFMSSNILIFGQSTPKRSIAKWANSSTLHNSAVHRTSTFIYFKQFLRENCYFETGSQLFSICTLLLLHFFFFSKDFPE